MAIGRGDASIGPSWAPCEVSAELSIVGATSGGSDVGGGASQSRQVWSQARLAARTVLRVIQGGRLITCCAATQGEALRAQRRVSGEGAALIWVGVAGECPAWQRSALASCGNRMKYSPTYKVVWMVGPRNGQNFFLRLTSRSLLSGAGLHVRTVK